MSFELISWAEEAIRRGAMTEVSGRLKNLKTESVPRESCQALANICRRCGMVAKGLRLLEPLVFDARTGWLLDVSPSELAEYGALLWKSGATGEAIEILERIDSDQEPNALLYLAYCHFTHWEYERGAQCLRPYLEKKLTPYQLLLGQVNLASALVTIDSFQEAEALLEQTISRAQEQSLNRLLGNCFEMRAQILISRKDFALALQTLDLASQHLGSNNAWDSLFVRKWKAVIESAESGSIEPLLAIRKEAATAQHWETVRDCDLQTLRIFFDAQILNQLYFGTRSAGFRQRIVRVVGQEPRDSFYTFGSQSPSAPLLDLAASEIRSVGKKLKVPTNINRLLSILSMDLYKPLSLGEIFIELYPGEHFNIFSSPKRVHQMIYRARNWLAENAVCLRLEANMNTHYWIRPGQDLAICKPKLMAAGAESNEFILQKLLRECSNNETFSAKEMREKLNISSTSFSRFVTWGLANNHFQREGRGPSVKYRISNSIRA